MPVHPIRQDVCKRVFWKGVRPAAIVPVVQDLFLIGFGFPDVFLRLLRVEIVFLSEFDAELIEFYSTFAPVVGVFAEQQGGVIARSFGH